MLKRLQVALPLRLYPALTSQTLKSGKRRQISFVPASPDDKLDVIYTPGSATTEEASVDRLADRLHKLADLVRTTSSIPMRLWIIAPGGYPGAENRKSDPVQSSVWSFGRTVSNEYDNHDVRLVDFANTLTASDQAARLANLIQEPGEEREILLEDKAQSVIRVRRGWPQPAKQEEAFGKDDGCQLYHPRTGSFDRLKWIPAKRRKPDEGEVEIEVRGRWPQLPRRHVGTRAVA